MVVKYQIIDGGKILVQKFIGVYSIKTYIQYARKVLREMDKTGIEKVVIDFRDCEFPGNGDFFNDMMMKMVKVRSFIMRKQKQNEDVLVVFWVDKPLPTVIATIFTNNMPFLNYDYCSTTDRLVEIINVSHTPEEFEILVSQLENKFAS